MRQLSAIFVVFLLSMSLSFAFGQDAPTAPPAPSTPAATPAPTALVAPAAPVAKLVLKEGTDVKLKFTDNLSSKTAAEGDPVNLTLDEDLKVGDVVVV